MPGTPRLLEPFFWLTTHTPKFARWLQPLLVRLVPLFAPTVSRHLQQNAKRIFGSTWSRQHQPAFTREVVNNFYQFVLDIGQSRDDSPEQLRAKIERVEGADAYRALRAGGRGAVLITAHLGSFEVGLAALTQVEPSVHVVYKRDLSGTFESMRMRLRQRLGVHEVPIDDGLTAWLTLRDALLNGEAVVMQADRAMPGQRSVVVPFLHGHLRVPTGAVRLARLTGSPIIPVFTIRSATGRFIVQIDPVIEPGNADSVPGASDSSVRAVAKSIEAVVANHPTQWLMLGPAFEEDAALV
ncbi:MAG: lysophospholipid acyltransferase family protein [bacterium]|nr:lysophospholipid acyltransferase family protein [bacterium]